MREGKSTLLVAALVVALVVMCLVGCRGQTTSDQGNANGPISNAGQEETQAADNANDESGDPSNGSSDADVAPGETPDSDGDSTGETQAADNESAVADQAADTPAPLAEELGLAYDLRDGFAHGDKGPEYQKYIVIHDTEVDSTPESIIDAWDSQGTGVATHFVVGKDGSVVQCVLLDQIAHHAGFGDAGHNERFGVEDESRDDKVGTTPIGSSYPDYGMNSYSVGIELVHVGSTGEGYPDAQLQALDKLIAYIDAYYGGSGKGGTIIDHKTWRTTNSDTSTEFAGYLASYRERRTYE